MSPRYRPQPPPDYVGQIADRERELALTLTRKVAQEGLFFALRRIVELEQEEHRFEASKVGC